MRPTSHFKILLRSILTSTFMFAGFTLVFIFASLLFEYQWHLSDYQITQNKEFTALQQNTKLRLEDLKHLSELTEARIVASQGNLKRIQNILVSVPRLYPYYEFPAIQKLSYAKIATPQALVTRVGILPLDSGLIPPDKDFVKGTLTTFTEDTVTSKTIVFNEVENVEGILEIQMNLSEFKASLGNYSTLGFKEPLDVHEAELPFLQQKPFVVYGTPPDSFETFSFKNISRYTVFLLFIVVCVKQRAKMTP